MVIRSEAIVNQRRKVEVEDIELSTIVSKGRIDINACIFSNRLIDVFILVFHLLLFLLISFEVGTFTFLQPPGITVTCVFLQLFFFLSQIILARITFSRFLSAEGLNWSVHGQWHNSLRLNERV